MRPISRRRASGGFAASLLVLGVAGRAHALSAADFYRGKDITLLVGYGPGGGYDITARLVARYLGKYIPGHPTIVVQNMPGAGSMRAANYTYVSAPKDGATIALIARDMPLVGLLGVNPQVQFDVGKLNWLGSSSSYADDAYVLLVGPKSPVKSVVEARAPTQPSPASGGGQGGGTLLVLGSAGGTDADVPRILQDAIGIRSREVLGYTSSASVVLAVERGEVDGRMFDYSYVKKLRPQWLKPGSGFHLLLQYARRTRHPDLADVPTARELALDAKARALIVFAETPLLTMARPFMAPPGVPADRLDALRAAFAAAHRDPDFLAEGNKLGLDISPVSAAEMGRALDEMAHAPPEVFDYMKRLMAGSNGG
jgi:tripartite-type tricarboxylate transporter receptor subunit TctC